MKSFAFYVLRFSLSLIGVCAFVYGIALLLTQFAPEIARVAFTGPASIGVGVAVFILPPLQTGQSFFKNEGRRMTGKEGWGLAFVCSFIFTVAMVGISYASLRANPVAFDEISAVIQEDAVTALLPVVMLVPVVTLIYRLFFWAAIRGQMKRAAKAN